LELVFFASALGESVVGGSSCFSPFLGVEAFAFSFRVVFSLAGGGGGGCFLVSFADGSE